MASVIATLFDATLLSHGVAEMLGEDEDWLEEISLDMDPEDGRVTVWGIGQEAITAFTDLGIENLAEIVRLYKADRT